MINPRCLVVSVLKQVIQSGHALSSELDTQLNKHTGNDRAVIHEMTYGVMRYYELLIFIENQLVKKKIKAKDADIRMLLLVGLYQLLYMDIPDYAVVSETVDVAKTFRKQWAVSFLNGVFRQFIRHKEEILANVENNEAAKWQHPAWLIKKIKKSWPEQWQSILNANNEKPPLFLRINQRKTTVKDYQQLLKQDGFNSESVHSVPAALLLDKTTNVLLLPKFDQGYFSVQDAGAQIAAHLLKPETGQIILDACAAPGGKSCHLLENCQEIQLTALDIDEKRSQKIRANLSRLQLKATVKTADASTPELWWNGQQFDKIILDAPCSATGVIRRHPDIKYLRRATDIADLHKQQGALLCHLWPLLKQNGTLLYITCSVLKEENDVQMQQFFEHHEDAALAVIQADWGEVCEYGRQILPGEKRMDGFYYALLIKR